MKTLEKIGVTLAKAHDHQAVFNYYDRNDQGYIDYKQFAKYLYSKDKHHYKVKTTKSDKSETPKGYILYNILVLSIQTDHTLRDCISC
jgi:hypothetical protein